MSTATAQPATYGRDASIAKFSVPRYQRMIETGILDANDHVELLEGYVVLKMPRNPGHDGSLDLFRFAVERLIPPGWWLRMQQAVTLPDSQPEPDFAIVRGSARSFISRHPTAADFGIIVEIADSTLLRDRQDKARIYARAGIPVYWIVNLVDRRIEVHTQPSGPTAVPAYASNRPFVAGDSVPLELDGNVVASVPVVELLP
jgi:Uma2 family endonuclease